jgi:hypothetical protein
VVAEEVKRGERVWHDVGWGFNWYARQAGARPVVRGAPPPPRGDIVVVASSYRPIIGAHPNKKLLRRIVFNEPGGRIQDERAGFWSNSGTSMLPWYWSRKELGRIEVWRME